MMGSPPSATDLSSLVALIHVLADKDASKATIAQMTELATAAAGARDEMLAAQTAAADERAKAEAARAEIANAQLEIVQRSGALDTRARTLQDHENSIAAREQKTAAANEDLARREASLADQQQKLSAAKSAFEAQIAKLSELRQAAQ